MFIHLARKHPSYPNATSHPSWNNTGACAFDLHTFFVTDFPCHTDLCNCIYRYVKATNLWPFVRAHVFKELCQNLVGELYTNETCVIIWEMTR